MQVIDLSMNSPLSSTVAEPLRDASSGWGERGDRCVVTPPPAESFKQVMADVVVQSGDTLVGLVRAHHRQQGIPLTESQAYRMALRVAERNQISNPDQISPGQKVDFSDLQLPALDRNMASQAANPAVSARWSAAQVINERISERLQTQNTSGVSSAPGSAAAPYEVLDKTLQRAVEKGFVSPEQAPAAKDRILGLATKFGFDIDPATGKLNWRGSTPMADSMVYISVDRTGQWLLATSFGGHVNATQKIDREGRLASSQAQVFKSGGVNPHSIVLDQSNRFAYVPQLGTDEIRIHKFDPQSPQPLSEQAEVVKVKALSGPRHIVISSDNKYAYVLTEMTGQVLVYERNIDTGSLTLIQSVASQPDNTTLVPGRPRPPTGGNQVQDFDDSNMIFCAEIKLTPNGQFLFTSERTKSTLSTFKVDTQTGRIERVAITPTEEMPRGFNIDPSGQYLVATGQKSQMVSLYSIHPQTGALNQIERVPGGQGANWVTFVKTSGL